MKTSENKSQSQKIFFLLVILFGTGIRFVESATPSLEYGRVFYNLGLGNEQRGQWKNALKSYKKAVEFNPDLAEAYDHMAMIFHNYRDFDKTIEFAQNAINHDPQYHHAYHTLGLAYQSKGNHQLALKYFAKANGLYPHYPFDSYYKYDLGIAYLNVGDIASAKQCVRDLHLSKEDQLADQLELIINQK